MSELLAAVRNYLDITWTDEEGDKKLLGYIARGCDYINSETQRVNDYGTEGLARALLFDYCRYARSGATDEFRVNYGPDLRKLALEAAREAAENDTE